MPVRVRLHRASRHAALRPERARGAPAHGRGARAPGPVRRRHGDAGSRVGCARRAGLPARVRHPVRRRVREEPLRRAHVHPAEPEGTRQERAPEAQPAHATTSRANASSSSRTRSCAAPRRARSSRCCARPARPKSTSACRRRRTGGRASTVSTPASAPICSRPTCRSARSPTTSASIRSRTSISSARSRRPASSGESFCTACFSGDYPVPVPDHDTKHALEVGERTLHVSGTIDRRVTPRRGGSGSDDERLTYAAAGVDIAAGEKAVERIKEHVRSTFRREVVGDLGGFGGLFALDWKQYHDPLLVSSTDGVGTKSLIARLAESPRHDRHRLRRDVGRRHRGPRRGTVVLPRLHLGRSARRRRGRRARRRCRRRLSHRALRAARRRDVGASRTARAR